MKLGVLGVWYHIFSSQGYIFFGTASALHRMFQAHVRAMGERPRAERTKYLVLDPNPDPNPYPYPYPYPYL